MNTVQRIAKNTGVLFFAQIITMFLGLILVIFITRFLGDIEFGKLAFAQSFTGMLVIFADVGLSTFAIREVARNKEFAGKYLGNIVCIKMLLSIITIALIIFIINLMHYPKDITFIVYLFGISAIISTFSSFFRSIFKAFEKMEYEAALNIIRSIIRVSIGLLLLFSGYGLIELAYVYIFVEILDFVFSFFVIIKKFAKPTIKIDFMFWRHLFLGALPFCMTSIVGLIYLRIDIIMLSFMKGDAVVGWYNAACTIVYILVIIPDIISYSVFPMMSRLFFTSLNVLKTTTEKFAKYLFILALPILIVLIILSNKIILIIYGDIFVNSIIILQILSLYLPIRFVNHAIGYTLSSVNKEYLRAFSAAIAAGFNIFLNLILIPRYSFIGAAIATVLTEIILFTFYYYFTAKHFHRFPLQKTFLKPSISCLCAFGFAYFLKWINPFLLAGLSVFVYLVVLFLIKTFDSDDKRIFKNLISNHSIMGK